MQKACECEIKKVKISFALSASRELEIIQRGLDSFSYSTCIRFFPRGNERDYVSIESRSGYVKETYKKID